MRVVHWFRNDLRLRDNTALSDAAAAGDALIALFVLDPEILRRDDCGEPRKRFLFDCLARLADDLSRAGSRLVVRRGEPAREIGRLLDETGAELLTWNRDTSPFARRRDARVRAAAGRRRVRILERRDRVIFESDQVRTQAGGAYSVYSPFARTWFERLAEEPMRPERAPRLPPPVPELTSEEIPAIPEDGGLQLPTGGSAAATRRLRTFLSDPVRDYAGDRERPDRDGTSRLSPHLRFGTLSIRDCVYAARNAAHERRVFRKGARKWIDELVWREFCAAVLEENPANLRRSYRREYDAIRWLDRDEELLAWKQGRTGFPIVDAGMRQLRTTGWMHNRVRMIVASFLTKDLLVDWRRGERFFFERLVDGDPASNNAGWQWAASTGTDPQPYFRIFNPTTQGQRYDPEGRYVQRFVPELRGLEGRAVHEPWRAPLLAGDYPAPMVDHAERRKLALERFGEAREAARD